MTAPLRHARRVLVVYWLTVLGGLALFSATRTGDAELAAPLWIGAIGGTLLGHCLALHRFRLWIAAVIIAGAGAYGQPLVAFDHAVAPLWLAYVPAALCAFWSLGDRTALAAAWFPIVLWMLPILDRSDRLAPDGAAAVLLGALAALFLGLLAARESRRVALWRSVAAQPLAIARPTELLREPPGHQLGRAGWWLTVGALTVAITVWLVPPLWRSEALGGDPAALADDDTDDAGPPCCPLRREADTQSARIKEYLGIGLGHDEHAANLRDGIDCRICPDDTAPPDGRPGRARGGEVVAGTPIPPSVGVVIDMSATGSGNIAVAPGTGAATFTGRGGYVPPALNTPIPSPPVASPPRAGGSLITNTAPVAAAPPSPLPMPPTGADPRLPPAGADPRLPPADVPPAGPPMPPTGADPRLPPADVPPPMPPSIADRRVPPAAVPPAAVPPAAVPPAAVPPAAVPPAAVPPAAVPPAAVPPADVPPAGPPMPPAVADPRMPPVDVPPPVPAPAPAAAAASTLDVPPVPAALDAASSAAQPRAGAAGRPTRTQRAIAGPPGVPLLRWLVLAVVAAGVFQAVRLALRPVRRLVTLRHLRRPFWDETIDQRVSNAWQLALVGLRDAGWRTGASEAPRELARRVGVAGLDRCATILERARHGVGLDAGDLVEMQGSADAAYRAARTGIGGLARVLGWLRWPLT